MIKSLFSTSIAFFLVIFAGIAPSSSSALNLSSPGRPVLEVDGSPRPDISQDIVSLTCDSSLKKLEITLTNWDASTFSYKYSDGNLLVPGVRIALYMGPTSSPIKIFEGAITASLPHFNVSTPPTLSLSITGACPPATGTNIPLGYGAELLHFNPTLTSRAGIIDCTGLTDGNPDLRPGATLSVTGVGQRYTRTYQVTKTIHTFDQSSGYKTQFHASTRPEIMIRKS
jgi:phage protein D